MKTVIINDIKYEAHEAPHGTSPCSLCCVKPCYIFGHLNSYKHLCMGVPNGYLKRAADKTVHLEVCCSAGGGHSECLKRASSADSTNVTCEELTTKLDIARTALALIYSGVKVCRTIDEIRALCAKTLEETK